ncbi:hypothetical protein T439DRAFT_68812 [Meredithblackwellia eburnea MCA 4105]
MSTTQTTTTQKDSSVLKLRLVGGDAENVPNWIKDLRTQGWTVVPKVISEDRAQHYVNEMYTWLESWGTGFDRTKPETRDPAKLPMHVRGGLYKHYGVSHEQFVWDLKSEPGLVDVFATVWDTNKLLVSFDGLNMSMPSEARPKDDIAFKPWSHVDQSPLRTNLQCVQGILNLLPNGPDDGGLMVMQGSSALYTQLWEAFEDKKPEGGWNTWEQQFLTEDMNNWLLARGCKWLKVCAGPGDLLLWDSRTVHYGALPTSTNDRFAAYVCYKPAEHVDEETKKERLEVFAKKQHTAHDPSILRVTERDPPEDHPTYAASLARPLQEPVLSKTARQLIGLDSY